MERRAWRGGLGVCVRRGGCAVVGLCRQIVTDLIVYTATTYTPIPMSKPSDKHSNNQQNTIRTSTNHHDDAWQALEKLELAARPRGGGGLWAAAAHAARRQEQDKHAAADGGHHRQRFKPDLVHALLMAGVAGRLVARPLQRAERRLDDGRQPRGDRRGDGWLGRRGRLGRRCSGIRRRCRRRG